MVKLSAALDLTKLRSVSMVNLSWENLFTKVMREQIVHNFGTNISAVKGVISLRKFSASPSIADGISCIRTRFFIVLSLLFLYFISKNVKPFESTYFLNRSFQRLSIPLWCL